MATESFFRHAAHLHALFRTDDVIQVRHFAISLELKAAGMQVGFMFIDQLAQQHQISVDRVQHKALVGRGSLWGQKVLLAKPQTYMNDSGVSVGRLAKFYKVSSDDCPA